MLLIFYGLQIALNVVTDSLGIDQIDIDPMVAGIITLGFIYGAYFTETFRGAFMAVPKGHIRRRRPLVLPTGKPSGGLCSRR